MEENPIFFADGADPKMLEAYKKAQETFKYFWREQSWEYRRIIPGLSVSCVKVAFSQEDPDSETPIVEHMWINEINFDGDKVKGYLINQPNELTNIQIGDYVEVPLNEISDWLFAMPQKAKKSKGLSKLFSSSSDSLPPKAYGGFTIQKMRSDMSPSQRKNHDDAWQMDFGDFNDIEIVYEQKENPENLIEHPMSRNMKEDFVKFINENPDEVTGQDANGYSLLHTETIAGNLSSVEVILKAGADRNLKTNSGKTALDFAKQLNWEHLIPVLEN